MSNVEREIEARSKFGIKLGLENISQILNGLDNPQDKVKIIHIAGTNGKGSVSSILSSVLQVAGNQVAKYCSPYLISLKEMFVINENNITTLELEEYYRLICQVEAMQKIELTKYEVTTVIMFMYAASHQVDYLILEVGLGGRLDATNIVTPIASIITNISLDHTNILGTTISQIANEKAGIIKPGVRLYTSESNPQVLDIFKVKTNLITEVNTDLEYTLNFEDFTTDIRADDIKYSLSLFGIHQVANFALAKAVLNDIGITNHQIAIGSKNVNHPARLERITNNIIFDGAHNPASAMALVKSLKNYPGPINVIVSVLGDKDVRQVISILRELSSSITFIPIPDEERGMSSSDISKLQIPNLKIESNLEQAIVSEMLNLVCGSFSLYSYVIKIIDK